MFCTCWHNNTHTRRNEITRSSAVSCCRDSMHLKSSAEKTKTGMVHSVIGWTRGVQVKLWDPLRTCAIPEHLRGVFTTRCYTNSCLSSPFYLLQVWHFSEKKLAVRFQGDQEVAVWHSIPYCNTSSHQLDNNLDSSRAGKLMTINCWQVVLSWVALYMSANSSSSQTLRRLTANTTHISISIYIHSVSKNWSYFILTQSNVDQF